MQKNSIDKDLKNLSWNDDDDIHIVTKHAKVE